MIVARRSSDLRELPGPFALSVGVFDGVHRGHAAILEALGREARAEGASSVVVFLHPHPKAVLRPAHAPAHLSTPEERIELIGRHGPDAVFAFPFDRETASLEPGAFLERLVPEGERLAVLVVGYDFRMGRGRSAGYEELRSEGHEEGFRVVRVGAVGDGEPTSSSRIRELLEHGEVAAAARLLGHPYLIRGTVVPGRGVGRTLDFPTANVDVGDSRKLLPKFGVYAVRVRIPGEAEARPGVMNRGVRPTFGGSEPTLEVHLPGFEGDLVGAVLDVEVVERIREERAFDGPGALAARIGQDVEEARKILERREI